TIADNVGDNVGDVAGMGADLYESYAGSILATAALGASAYLGTSLQYNAVIAPMLVAAVGTLLSILGIFLVRTKEGASQKELLSSLRRGVNSSSLFVMLLSFGIVKWLGLPIGVWWSMVIGLISGIIIGEAT